MALGLEALNQPPEPVEVSGQVEGGGRNDQDTRPPCGPAALSLLLLAGLALAGVVWAESSSGTAVDRSVLSGGGAPAESSSGAVTLNGTLGQTVIGSSSCSGATVGAGFWYGLGKGAYEICLPLTLRNYN